MRHRLALSLVSGCVCLAVAASAQTSEAPQATPAAAPAPAQAPAADAARAVPGGNWLDATPVARWNSQGAAVPTPPAKDGEPLTSGRCGGQMRPPETPGDRALTAAGWVLVGPLQQFGEVSLATAAVTADGMCRPLGLQAFVFVRGRFAGTLSPHPMDARTDGVIADLRLVTRDRIHATYARYASEDPLCCPSRSSAATFGITRSPGGSVLALESVTTTPSPR